MKGRRLRIILSVLLYTLMASLGIKLVGAQEIQEAELQAPMTFVSRIVSSPNAIEVDSPAMEIIFHTADGEKTYPIESISDQAEQEIKLKSAYCSRVKRIKVNQEISFGGDQTNDFPETKVFLFHSREGRLSIAIRLDPNSDIYTEYILK